MNNLQWNFDRNQYSFIEENAFEDVVCVMASMLSRSQSVDPVSNTTAFAIMDIESLAWDDIVLLAISGPRLNIKTVLSTYGYFHVKDKTAVRTSYL